MCGPLISFFTNKKSRKLTNAKIYAIHYSAIVYQVVLERVGPDVIFDELCRFVRCGVHVTEPEEEATDVFMASFSSLHLGCRLLCYVLHGKRRKHSKCVEQRKY